MPRSRTLALIAVALLLLTAGASANCAHAQTPRGQANTWDSRQRQPDQAQVTRKEKQAGIEPSKPQQNATGQELQRVQRELNQTGPNAAGSASR